MSRNGKVGGAYHNDPTVEHVNDPLTGHATGAGRWGMPTEPDHLQEPAHVPPSTFDYSAGMFAEVPVNEMDAVPGILAPHQLHRRSDVPNSYQVPHEATHRRYEPPFTVPVTQTAAGFLLLAPPKFGLHFLKMVACFITLDAAGTLQFVQGSADGNSVAAVSGTMALGGQNGALALAPALLSTPWFFTSPDQGLGILTATGKAQGFATLVYSPYEA